MQRRMAVWSLQPMAASGTGMPGQYPWPDLHLCSKLPQIFSTVIRQGSPTLDADSELRYLEEGLIQEQGQTWLTP